MNDHYDPAGFADSVLDSYDDYEPYGFVAPPMMPVAAVRPATQRDHNRDRVIEAELLSHSSMVGC
jgi:hypothetical protein